jgi:Protein of unknown function (DUF2971)
MTEIPGHASPPYSEDAREDALFHYTTASGLIGILENGELWNTAYFCANDESELAAGKGVLERLFRSATYEMVEANDPLVHTFRQRGVDIRHYADGFEQLITGFTLSSLCAYMTCFCKPLGAEDFCHGLLSQWRGYGPDGGYALQFSKKKILAEIEKTNTSGKLNFQLHDVHYNPDNHLKAEVLSHQCAFLRAYKEHLEELAMPLDFAKQTMKNPIAGLVGGPLESFLDYLIHTKNQHFLEERECRLSFIDVLSARSAALPVNHLNRNGMIVPYKKTPKATFDVLKCLEWIVIGPAPRMDSRFKSVVQLVQRLGLHIYVRPSHIPFTRS